MPEALPDKPDLEQLRRRAKELARAYRERDLSAVARVQVALQRFRARPLPFRLTHAQAVIAREHGFPSWARLKTQVEALAGDASLAAPGVAEAPHLRMRPAKEIAAVLVALSRALEIEELASSLAIGRRKTLRVREVLLDEGTHSVLVDALLLGIRHRNPAVRYVCAHAMDIFADERCAGALLELLDDPVPRVRRIAVHSLACDECKVVPLQPLLPPARARHGRDLVARVVDLAMRDPSIQVRRHAAFGLGMFADVRATQAIELLLARETDAAIRRNALGALRRVRGPAGPPERAVGSIH